MRRLLLPFLAMWLTSLAVAQGTGGLAGGVRMQKGTKGFLGVRIRVHSTVAPGGASEFVFREGSFYLKGLPVGPVEICVAGFGTRTIFDTATIKKNSVTRREYVIEPDVPRREPYPDCDRTMPVVYIDPVDSAQGVVDDADAFPVWESVLRHYRKGLGWTEGDFVRETNRITGASPDTAGEATVVLSLHQDVAPVAAFLAWFDSLTAHGLVAATCDEIDVKNCPQTEVTTFLKLDRPKRLHGDTMLVRVDETGMNPAHCRAGEGMMGFWSRSFVTTPRDGRWEVFGRGDDPSITATGICQVPRAGDKE